MNPDRIFWAEVTVRYLRSLVAVLFVATIMVVPSSSSAQSVGQFASPTDYRAIPDFRPEVHLPTRAMRIAHTQWWTGYNTPNRLWEDPPSEIFAPGSKSNTDRNGTFSYARRGTYFIASITDALRVTGDPALVGELVRWSRQLRTNLDDHDGRGYDYFQYFNPVQNVQRQHATDTGFLDEQLLAGNIALLAHALHQNRNWNYAAGREADDWFSYLDRNWIPKWMARSTRRNPAGQYVPPESLGLDNVTGWDSPDNPLHDDDHPSWDPNNYSDDDLQHAFPVRGLAHSYVASMFQFYAMADYFADRPSVFGGAAYEREAATRFAYWKRQSSILPDGSLEIPHRIKDRELSSDTDSYAQFFSIYMNALFWAGGADGAADEVMMTALTKNFINPEPGLDVYEPGNIDTMSLYLDGTGGADNYILLFNSLLAPWDDTGAIGEMNEAVILGATKHVITGTRGKHHMAHVNGQMNSEAVALLRGTKQPEPPLTSSEARILRLYRAALGRSPDAAGLAYWDDIHQTIPLIRIAEQFRISREWTLRFGNYNSDEDFVRLVYRNVLGREPDVAGRSYWIDVLRNGASRAAVIVEFSESPENVSATATGDR